VNAFTIYSETKKLQFQEKVRATQRHRTWYKSGSRKYPGHSYIHDIKY
jgi:hypothetical protein